MGLTQRWPPQGWACFQMGDDLHVVPVVGDDAEKPANGHSLTRGCSCTPKYVPVSADPMPLDAFVVWSHQEPDWPGADVRLDA